MKFVLLLLILVLIFINVYEKKEKFIGLNHKKKIYLVANNKNINREKLMNFLHDNKDHTYVFFNHIEPFKYLNDNDLEKIKNLKCKKMLFMRENHINSYWGVNEFKNQKIKLFDSQNSYIIPSMNGNTEKMENPFNLEIANFKHLIDNYPNNKEAQTGFVSYHILKDKYKDSDIILWGFTRKQGEDPADWFHEKNYELEYYKKNNIKNLPVE